MRVITFVFLTSVFLEAPGIGEEAFNITDFIVPEIVFPGQEEVEIECKYDANIVSLSLFKGQYELFRYKPRDAPSPISSPIPGVDRVEVLACDTAACSLSLRGLTEDATDFYKCETDWDEPTTKYANRKAYMKVYRHVNRKPPLEGLAKEFGEGDEMNAYCGSDPDTELRWYINGRELKEFRGSKVMKKTSSRMMFVGLTPTVTIHCAEYKSNELYGSNQEKALWKDYGGKVEKSQVQRNKSNIIKLHSMLINILSLYFLKL